MSTAIHRAIGWGVEWNKFEMISILDCEGHETAECLDTLLGETKPEDLIVPDDVRSLSWNTKNINAIYDPILCALDMNFTDEVINEKRVRIPPKMSKVSDLCIRVFNPDETVAVMFLPQARYIKDWYRRDSTLDYYFESYRNGASGYNDIDPRDITEVMNFNPYPFTNNLMDPLTGDPLEWKPWFELDDEYPNGWAPAVPSEIRWWVNKLGILDANGINQLRPMLMQWWT